MSTENTKSRSTDQILPGLALRIGFAGKRDLDAAAIPRLRREVSDVLALIERRVGELMAESEFRGLYRQTAGPLSQAEATEDPGTGVTSKVRLIFVSSLARGADLLACEVAVHRGWKLHVVLPFEADVFQREDGADTASRGKFEELLGKAESRFVMSTADFPPGEEQSTKDAAYDASGTLTVDYCDFLLTIWDEAAGGKGGTGDSVRKATDSKIPVIHIDSKGERGPRLGNGEPVESLRELIPNLLGMPSRELGIHEAKSGPRVRFHRYEEENSNPGWTPVFAYNWAKNLFLIGFRDERETKPKNGAETRHKHKGVPASMIEIEERAEKLANYFAGWTRGTAAINCLLSAFALSATVATKLWPGNEALEKVEIAGLVATLAAIIIYWHASRRELHARWIEYRVLTEHLYSSGLLMGIGASPRLRSKILKGHSEFSGWVNWYVDAIIREAGLASVTLDAPHFESYRTLLSNRQHEQAVEYHGPRHLQNEYIAHRIGQIGRVLFSVAIVSCLIQLPRFVEPKWLEPWFDGIKPALAVLAPLVAVLPKVAVLCAIWGAALAVFAYQAEFAKLARVSGIFGHQLEMLRRETNACINIDKLRELAKQTADIMMQEHEDWYLFYSLRGPEKPN